MSPSGRCDSGVSLEADGRVADGGIEGGGGQWGSGPVGCL